MEDLTKHQLILLVLLVSFVTSIATGIITFTLISEAPVEVTQTINRVVEKTIERVVTEEGQPEKVVTTVVVNEEDRILGAIAKNEKSIVRIKTAGAGGTEVVSGLGLVISADGLIVTDSRNYDPTSSYTIYFFDGESFSSKEISVDDERGLVFLEIAASNENPQYTFYPVTFGNSNDLKIGQTLVAITGRTSNAASIGRIFQLQFSEDKNVVTRIFSDITISRNNPGSPVLNLSGEVVGLEATVGTSDTEYSYIPANSIKEAVNKVSNR